MGVDRTDYIVYGWKLPYDMKDKNGQEIDFWDDKFLPMIEGWPEEELALVRDGMCGQYVVFGLMIKHADEYKGWDFIHLDVGQLDTEMVKARYRELFEIEGDCDEPCLFIFSHYS